MSDLHSVMLPWPLWQHHVFFLSFFLFLVTAGSITSGAHIAAPVRSWTKNEQRGADVGRASPALAEGSARVKIRDGFLGMRRS